MVRVNVSQSRSVVSWDGGDTPAAPLHGNSQRTASGAFAYPQAAELLERVTLTRTIGEFVAQITSSAAGSDRMIGAVGIIKASGNAASVGITALPSPLEDPTEDWIFHRMFDVIAGAGQTGGAPAQAVRFPFDLKSQRKIFPSEQLVAVGHIGIETGTITLETSLLVRYLYKLS